MADDMDVRLSHVRSALVFELFQDLQFVDYLFGSFGLANLLNY